MHGGGELREQVRGVAVGPAALFLECLRQVPVVERQPRQNVLLQEGVNQAGVVVQPLLVDSGLATHPVRTHSSPRGGEPVGLNAEVLHERGVGVVEVVLVAGDITVVPVKDGSRDPRERVPDRVLTSILVCGALHLVGGSGSTPEESFWECNILVWWGRHPLTAPCMMPATSWRPARKNNTSSGAVEIATPAMIKE